MPRAFAALALATAGVLTGLTSVAAAAVPAPAAQPGATARPGVGCDCSGLVPWAYHQAGFSLPRTAHDQSRMGIRVSLRDAREGDLLFYYHGIGHVAMVSRPGWLVESSQSGHPRRGAPHLHPGPAAHPPGGGVLGPQQRS